MILSEILKTIVENKKCDNCGANNESGEWIVDIKNETVYFKCERCGFKKEVK